MHAPEAHGLRSALEHVATLVKAERTTVPPDVLSKYAVMIEGNFTSWLSAAAIRCESGVAREAVNRNLLVEIREDHAGMLREAVLADPMCVPSPRHYATVSGVLAKTRRMAALGAPASLLTFLTYLEYASTTFLNVLRKTSSSRALEDYIRVHVAADATHGRELEAGLWQELRIRSAPDELLDGIQLGEELLALVFD